MLTPVWPSLAFSSKHWLKESFWSGAFWFLSHKNKKWMTPQGTAPATTPNFFFRAAAHNHLISLLLVLSEGSSGLWHAGRQDRWKAGRTQSEHFYRNDHLSMLFLEVPYPLNRKRIRQETIAQYSSAETKIKWNLANLPVLKWFPDNGKLGKWSSVESRHVGLAAKPYSSPAYTACESEKYRTTGNRVDRFYWVKLKNLIPFG